MAAVPASNYRISKIAQANVLSYARAVLEAHKRNTGELRRKMEDIDKAYARYVQVGEDGPVYNNVLKDRKLIVPIVASQVDAQVGYLADVFLSGSPIFPVVSSPAERQWAEQLETLIDDHAQLGGYVRELLMFLRDGVKYNYCAVEADWTKVEQFSVLADFLSPTGRSTKADDKYFTKLKRIDPYNLVCDFDVAPGSVAEEGDFAGYIEIISKIKLKRLLNKFSTQGKAYNATHAMESTSVTAGTYYIQPPTISNYISGNVGTHNVDWTAYLTGNPGARGNSTNTASYEKFTLYARIIPSDFGIIGPQPNTPQIWKFIIINSEVVVYAERIISAYDFLPILVGQPIEDGLSYQTKSVAEGGMPFQEGASDLFAIRFNAARRSVSDRALYNPDMISPSDINAPVPAPKIPVRISSLSNKTLADAYHQIPFDPRGTEQTISDAGAMIEFGKQLAGQNNAVQGQFQRGNKSVQEWTDVMGNADNRLRLPALTLEHQVFMPLKNIIVLNIFQYGEDTIVVSQKTGAALKINISELRQHVLSFKIADGYTPKSKLASTEMLVSGMNMLMNSPQLQQAFGTILPAMWAHMMQLGGVRGLEEYAPEAQQNAAALPQGLEENTMAAPVAPSPNIDPMAAAAMPVPNLEA